MRALRTLQLGWIPLVLVAALALSGFAIYRMHGIFGSHQTPALTPASDSRTCYLVRACRTATPRRRLGG
jgi:Mycobacterium membrane protein